METSASAPIPYRSACLHVSDIIKLISADHLLFQYRANKIAENAPLKPNTIAERKHGIFRGSFNKTLTSIAFGGGGNVDSFSLCCGVVSSGIYQKLCGPEKNTGSGYSTAFCGPANKPLLNIRQLK
jgi:hypothetical protein